MVIERNVLKRTAAFLDFQTEWVYPVHRIVECICEEIYATLEPDRVFTDEPTDILIVVAHPVIINAGFGVELTSRELEWVGERPGRRQEFSEGVVAISVRQRSRGIAERSDRAEDVGLIVARRAATQHRQGLIKSWPVIVTCQHIPRVIQLLLGHPRHRGSSWFRAVPTS